MEFLTEHNILSLIVIFLLFIVLVIQIQMSKMNAKIEDTGKDISKKIDELLKKKIRDVLRNQ